MFKEIERKFLLKNSSYQNYITGSKKITQTYLYFNSGICRIRINDSKAFLTLKSRSEGIVRAEFEYEIPLTDAGEMMKNLAVSDPVSKIRYSCYFENKDWIVDIFEKENRGLAVTEVELENENEKVILPPWAGPEISLDHRYSNSSLAEKPFSKW